MLEMCRPTDRIHPGPVSAVIIAFCGSEEPRPRTHDRSLTETSGGRLCYIQDVPAYPDGVWSGLARVTILALMRYH